MITYQYDIFFSYPRRDQTAAMELYRALTAANLNVFLDQNDIRDTDSISTTIAESLGQSKLLLAWYSAHYPKSRPCQWELTAAILAGTAEGSVGARVMAVNPEDGVGHIHPLDICNTPLLSAVDVDGTVRRILAQVRTLTTPLSAVRSQERPRWYGQRRLGSTRFAGRLAEMWQVHSLLNAAEAFAAIAGTQSGDTVRVHGMGGIGKSLLAEEYAHRFGAAYPGGIVWLSAAAPRQDQIYTLALECGLHIQGLEPVMVHGMLRGYFERLKQPYLWVIDDLPAEATVADLGEWLPPSANGRTLITTRGIALGRNGATLALGVLNPAEALELLLSHRPVTSTADQTAAESIVAALGGHALAVEVAGAAVVEMGYRRFLERLADRSKDVLDLAAELVGQLPNDHEPQIAATLLDSITRLHDTGLRVLQLASLLAVAPIPRALIAGAFDRLDGDSGEDTALRGINAAARHSLIDRDGDSVKVHALVSRTMRFRLPAPQAMAPAAVATVLEVMPEVEDIRRHEALAGWVAQARALAETEENEGTLGLRHWLAQHDYQRGDYAGATKLGYQTWQGRTRLLGAEHPDTLRSANDLANTLQCQGNLAEARALHEQTLAARRRVLGEEHRDTLMSMNDLATTLHAQGDIAGARALEEHTLNVRRRLLGEEDRDTLLSVGNLASTLHAQGDLAGARALNEQALAVRRRVLGEEHPDTLTAMGNLAGTLQAQGDLAGARTLEEQALAVRRRVLGEEHPDTLTAMGSLATTLQAQGDLAGARILKEQVLAVRRRVLGEEHPSTLTTMNNLAATLQAQGDLTGARDMQDLVLAVRRRVLGEEHPDTLASMGNLATTLQAQGDLTGARALEEQALTVRRRVLGEEHPNTLTAMGNLASTFYAQGDLAGARALEEQVLAVSRRVLGEEHPSTLTAMSNLANILWAQGDLVGARDMQDLVLAVRRRVLGEKHPDTLIAMNNLASTLLAQGNRNRAAPLLQRALALSRITLGKDHPTTHNLARNLAACQQRFRR